jgi:hypothetical protein
MLWSTPAEIRHLPQEEQACLLAEVRRRLQCGGYLVNAPVEVIGLALGLLLALVQLGLSELGPRSALMTALQCFLLLGTLGLVFAATILLEVTRNGRTRRRALRGLLLEWGIRPGVCFRCRKDLRAFDGDCCPDCEEPLVAAGLRKQS